MTDTKHTPGPLKMYRVDVACDACRSVACVNACEGINPEAVPDMVEAIGWALKSMEVGNGTGWVPEGLTWDDVKRLRDALAKATGGTE